MLSHDNLVAECRTVFDTGNIEEGKEVIVSFLPLAHAAAQV